MLLFVQKYAVSVVRILLTVIADYCSRSGGLLQRRGLCPLNYVAKGHPSLEQATRFPYRNVSLKVGNKL